MPAAHDTPDEMPIAAALADYAGARSDTARIAVDDDAFSPWRLGNKFRLGLNDS